MACPDSEGTRNARAVQKIRFRGLFSAWLSLQLYVIAELSFQSDIFLLYPVGHCLSMFFTLIASPAILAGEIFPCKGTASVRSSSTVVLTRPRIERQPSANQRFGYSVKFPAVYLPLPSFSRCWTRM